MGKRHAFIGARKENCAAPLRDRPTNAPTCSDVDVRAIVSFVLAITLVVVPVTKLSLGL